MQLFCWDHLARWGPDAAARWHVATALAALLDALGLERYARIAAGETTRQILTAADQGSDRGRGLARKAAQRSGIDPPGTELITWGAVMEPAEAAALEAVADRLEMAIAAGDLVPGARGWRDQQAEITVHVLTTPVPALGGQSSSTGSSTSGWAAGCAGRGPPPGPGCSRRWSTGCARSPIPAWPHRRARCCARWTGC